MADLASQDPQGPGLTAMDRLGCSDSCLALCGSWASAQAPVAATLRAICDRSFAARLARLFYMCIALRNHELTPNTRSYIFDAKFRTFTPSNYGFGLSPEFS